MSNFVASQKYSPVDGVGRSRLSFLRPGMNRMRGLGLSGLLPLMLT